MGQNPGFLELKRLEAAKEIATLLSQGQNRVMLATPDLLDLSKSVALDRSLLKAVSQEDVNRMLAETDRVLETQIKAVVVDPIQELESIHSVAA